MKTAKISFLTILFGLITSFVINASEQKYNLADSSESPIVTQWFPA